MRLLLGSHILLWYADGDGRLSQTAVLSIQTAEDLWFSAVSVWELSMKIRAGKLPERDVEAMAERLGCALLPMTASHATAVLNLPRIHGDPFDHMLLAQAKAEGLTLLTHDEKLARYGVAVILV